MIYHPFEEEEVVHLNSIDLQTVKVVAGEIRYYYHRKRLMMVVLTY
jgi:hypothetical protein